MLRFTSVPNSPVKKSTDATTKLSTGTLQARRIGHKVSQNMLRCELRSLGAGSHQVQDFIDDVLFVKAINVCKHLRHDIATIFHLALNLSRLAHL